MSVRETFHIEILGPADDTAGVLEPVLQRISVRTEAVDEAIERAVRLFARARAPQRPGDPAEGVRVIDGAGTELFRRSRFDAPDPG